MAKTSIFDLSGKVALITGGGSNIGRAYCEAMAEFGADVACADINEKIAQETVGLIKKFGHRAIAIQADVSKQSEVEDMVKRAVKELGTLDIVFANAGIADPGRLKIHEKPVEEWDAIMNLNLRGVFLLMRAVFPIMMSKKSGSFITTASVGGLSPTPAASINAERYEYFRTLVAYCSSKAGAIMLTKMAARQYGEFGIRVNAICPGGHGLSIVPPERRQEVKEVTASVTPLRRVGEPEELKGLAVWLASDASSYATGQAFVQDGGLIA